MADTNKLSESSAEKQKKAIKNALKKQLKINGTTGKYYLDLVEDYMDLWEIKNKLFADVKQRGVVTEYDNGGGQKGKTPHDSVAAVLKVNDRMTRILDSLGIKPQVVAVSADDDNL